jgi:hypothetical protein
MSQNSKVVGRNVSRGRCQLGWTQDKLAGEQAGVTVYQGRLGVELANCLIPNSTPKDCATRQINTFNSPSAADSPLVGGGKS